MSATDPGRRKGKELEDVLRGKAQGDADSTALANTGREVESAYSIDVPPADRQRALFVSGAGARRSTITPARLLAPAIGVAALMIVALLSAQATPGDTLYPVRKALGRVGLAATPADEAERRIDHATELVEDAETQADPTTATSKAIDAIGVLGAAEEYARELDGRARITTLQEIESLRGRAIAVLATALPAAASDDGDDRGSENSGPGSSNSGSGSSNSGPGSDDSGSDDSGSDNSGPGSDDSGDDDRSGSDDGDGGDDTGDNSGPGGGDDGGGGDDTSDNSGPGGGGGDADDDVDNSGPGGGDDDDGDRSGKDDGGDEPDDDSPNEGSGSGSEN